MNALALKNLIHRRLSARVLKNTSSILCLLSYFIDGSIVCSVFWLRGGILSD